MGDLIIGKKVKLVWPEGEIFICVGYDIPNNMILVMDSKGVLSRYTLSGVQVLSDETD